ncbi:MAG TPA: hypothetical protein DDZ51_28955 [Planctomycetaceae bacterium]|nr:hypothetical protein [Planctomycetaceae bacterium]
MQNLRTARIRFVTILMNSICTKTTAALFLLFTSGALRAAEPVDYANDVLPIFEKYCMACHTADEAQGGFVMQSFPEMMRGGETGPAITPGVPSSSRLFLMAAGQLEPVMPPDDAQGPNEQELATLATWIEQGAIGPDGASEMKRELRVPKIEPSGSASQPLTAIATRSDGVRGIAKFQQVQVLHTDGSEAIKLPPQPGKINSLVFSGDGTSLLVASGVTGLYGRAAVYKTATGDLIGEMIGHKDEVESAIFSADERFIATASYDQKIILWDAKTFEQIRTLEGHNGAVLSIAFTPDSSVLVSGSADETVKVWDVQTGRRLDTMSQPEGEVLAVAVSPNGKLVLGGSADNRLRVWNLLSTKTERINPLITSRYLDESPLIHLAITPDATRCVVIGESGNLKTIAMKNWTQIGATQILDGVATDMSIAADGSHVLVSTIRGDVMRFDLPPASDAMPVDSKSNASEEIAAVYVDTGTMVVADEATLRKSQSLADQAGHDAAMAIPRGAEVSGVISQPGEEDWFTFNARAGEMWVIETDSSGMDSRIDSIVEVRDSNAHPIIQTRLQAVRDSYFTFRGKDSTQTGDFRVFAWQEMKLGEYFYASGEVNRLWLYPRGADSGFDVFPGMGSRWTYFGTSGTVHALGEPAYIVRPLGHDESPLANGLPVFDIAYENDDNPSQTKGKDSYLIFKAPSTGRFLVRLRDTRGEGGDSYKYRLRVRPADPIFTPSVRAIGAPLLKGSGRELMVMVDRQDGFDSEVTFEIEGLPEGLISNFPITIQAGQRFATGTIYAPEGTPNWEGEVQPKITARALINHRWIERDAGVAGKLTLADRGNATLAIYPNSGDASAKSFEPHDIIPVRRGETISLIVRADRKEGFKNQIALGNEQAGRNLPFGAYVDNIGLNGLLIRENESERPFFITVDEMTQPGRRLFFLNGNSDGGITTPPITLEVLSD